ncbi:MAG: hypothetical protein GY833_12935 [Aestuariibacter sp.]|nr:hypothetical protein [Aestuariibacter sp.]|tara:strand:- start:152692 stop:152964 length:273 start_codon:yes stop_codon:yes gene_type:complete
MSTLSAHQLLEDHGLTAEQLLETGSSQQKLIDHYTKNLEKVLKSHGATSDYFTNAFFMLQGVNMGLSVGEAARWTTDELERLHDIKIDNA